MQGKEKFVKTCSVQPFLLLEDDDTDDLPLSCRNADNFRLY